MSLKESQRSLRAWTKQDWGTKSGKKSSETGERYLPKKAIASLSDSEYASTTRAKRKGTSLLLSKPDEADYKNEIEGLMKIEIETLSDIIPVSDLEKQKDFTKQSKSLKESIKKSKSGIICEFKRKSPSNKKINYKCEILLKRMLHI